MAPLLYASIRCDWAPIVIASDASEEAAGVVYRGATAAQVQSLSTLRAVPGEPIHESLQSFIDETVYNKETKEEESLWSVAIHHPWRSQQAHINEFETRSSLLGIKWSLKSPDILVPSSICHRKLLLLVPQR